MKKRQKGHTSSEPASAAEQRLSELPRMQGTATVKARGSTQSAQMPATATRGASASKGSSVAVDDPWDSETESRLAMHDMLQKALIDKNTAEISESISGRFEKCRDQMSEAIRKSRTGFIGIGLGVLAAVVFAVLAIVLSFVTPRLDRLDTDTAELRESVVRIETRLEGSVPLQPIVGDAIEQRGQPEESESQLP